VGWVAILVGEIRTFVGGGDGHTSMVGEWPRQDDAVDHEPPEATMTQLAALIGIVLIIVAIPFGLMLAPLALGIVFVWLALRHLNGAVERPIGEPA
jgi:hypothetical protein